MPSVSPCSHLPQLEAPRPIYVLLRGSLGDGAYLQAQHLRAAPSWPGTEGAGEPPPLSPTFWWALEAFPHSPQPCWALPGADPMAGSRPGPATCNPSLPQGGPTAAPVLQPFPCPHHPSRAQLHLKNVQPSEISVLRLDYSLCSHFLSFPHLFLPSPVLPLNSLWFGGKAPIASATWTQDNPYYSCSQGLISPDSEPSLAQPAYSPPQ